MTAVRAAATLAWLLAGSLLPSRVPEPRTPALPEELREEELKCEFIERFTRFVDWPAQALGAKHARFVLCIAGRGSVASHLARTAAGRSIKGRPVEVRRLQPGDAADACHLLFIAGDEEPRLHELRRLTVGRPILTVADTPGFAERGVIINMYTDDQRLGFELNVAVARHSQLTVSSQLLRLARLVGQ